MGNHDYIIYFIDRIFDVLIKKVFSFRTSMKVITGWMNKREKGVY